ncbi:hypothetical protein [Chitinivorax sp. B]|uniref:hypothetical protein n=1 Tax=Chitinivorax sp. B TaxID=2502235 RepID=UPI0010F93108|nr:hypothetical protein [Chitinivorax sp. B]
MRHRDPLLSGLLHNQPDHGHQLLPSFALGDPAPIGLDLAKHAHLPSNLDTAVTERGPIPINAGTHERRATLLHLLRHVLTEQSRRLMMAGAADALTAGQWANALVDVLIAQTSSPRPHPALAALLANAAPQIGTANTPRPVPQALAVFNGQAGFGDFENRIDIRFAPQTPQQWQLTLSAQLRIDQAFQQEARADALSHSLLPAPHPYDCALTWSPL